MTAPYRILIISTETGVLHGIVRLLQTDGYEIHTAEDGGRALAALREQEADLIVADQGIHDMGCVDFLELARGICPWTVGIILRPYISADDASEARDRDLVYRYVLKPWEDGDLRAAVRQALETARILKQNQELNRRLAEANAKISRLTGKLKREVDDRTQELRIRNLALEKFQHILHQIPVGILGLGEDKRVVFANRRARERLGPLPALLEQGVETLLGEDMAARLDSLSHGPGTFVFRSDPDETGSVVEIRGAVVRYPSGTRGFVLVLIGPCATAQTSGRAAA